MTLMSDLNPPKECKTFNDVLEFARAISAAGGFPIVETSKPSRDVLMLVNWNEGASIKIESP